MKRTPEPEPQTTQSQTTQSQTTQFKRPCTRAQHIDAENLRREKLHSDLAAATAKWEQTLIRTVQCLKPSWTPQECSPEQTLNWKWLVKNGLPEDRWSIAVYILLNEQEKAEYGRILNTQTLWTKTYLPEEERKLNLLTSLDTTHPEQMKAHAIIYSRYIELETKANNKLCAIAQAPVSLPWESARTWLNTLARAQLTLQELQLAWLIQDRMHLRMWLLHLLIEPYQSDLTQAIMGEEITLRMTTYRSMAHQMNA